MKFGTELEESDLAQTRRTCVGKSARTESKRVSAWGGDEGGDEGGLQMCEREHSDPTEVPLRWCCLHNYVSVLQQLICRLTVRGLIV